MKRKIKFRIWDKEGNRMIDGDSFTFEEYIPINYMFNDSNRFIFMQYTGLKDKNDKKVYEGDIVRIDYGDGLLMGIMEFYDFAWCIKSKYKNYKNLYYPIFCEDIDLIEVLGNIYENPELLENK
nr:MAG TPA: YopX protein [Caudoviricetes sp.]